MTLQQLFVLITTASVDPFPPTADLRELAALELIEPHEQGYRLASRGQVFLEHILALPLPQQVTTWRMPGMLERAFAEQTPLVDETVRRIGSMPNLHPPSADLAAGADDTPPSPPPKRRPIQGVEPAADLAERMAQAGQLLNRGFGLNEVAETLEMDAGEIDRHFFPGGP